MCQFLSKTAQAFFPSVPNTNPFENDFILIIFSTS